MLGNINGCLTKLIIILIGVKGISGISGKYTKKPSIEDNKDLKSY